MGVAGMPWVLCFFSMQRAERALHIEMGAGNDDAASAADAGKKHFLSARPISPQFGWLLRVGIFLGATPKNAAVKTGRAW